jgi:hypothetical protein
MPKSPLGKFCRGCMRRLFLLVHRIAALSDEYRHRRDRRGVGQKAKTNAADAEPGFIHRRRRARAAPL